MQEVFKNIIEDLKEKIVITWEHDYYGGRKDAFNEAIKIIEQAAAEYNNGWIPVSERLPTTEEYQRGNGRFLVTDGNRTYEAEFDIYESHTFGKSRMATDWFVTDKCVTHWQNEPLPPEYQPKGE